MSEPVATPVSENSPLVFLYWSGIVLSLFGVVAWIAAGLNVHSTSFFSADKVNDTAVAWVAVGTTATTVGVLALLLGVAVHAVNWQIVNRNVFVPVSRPSFNEWQANRDADREPGQ